MDTKEFNSIVEAQLDMCKNVLVDKAREYATDDRLHNFKIAATVQKETLRAAVAGMMIKHTVSVYDMAAASQTFPLEVWTQKITDHINYLLLMKAVLLEDTDGPVEIGPSNENDQEASSSWLTQVQPVVDPADEDEES